MEVMETSLTIMCFLSLLSGYFYLKLAVQRESKYSVALFLVGFLVFLLIGIISILIKLSYVPYFSRNLPLSIFTVIIFTIIIPGVTSIIGYSILGLALPKPTNIQNESVDSNNHQKIQKDNNIPIAAFDIEIPEKENEPIVSKEFQKAEVENQEIKKSFKSQKCSVCMNPNLKNLTVCEYCGNQIF